MLHMLITLCSLGKLGYEYHYFIIYLSSLNISAVYFRLRPNAYKITTLFNSKYIFIPRKFVKRLYLCLDMGNLVIDVFIDDPLLCLCIFFNLSRGSNENE